MDKSHLATDTYSSHALFKHLVYGPARYESFAAQWLEHPTGVRKVEGSILARDSHFSFFDMLITRTSLLTSSPTLKNLPSFFINAMLKYIKTRN